MVQLKTEEKYKWGQTNILPLLGSTKISDEGIIEAPSMEVAEQLEALEIGFSIVQAVEVKDPVIPPAPPVEPIKAPLAPQVESDELGKTDVDELGGREDEDTFEGSADSASSETLDIKITKEDLDNNPDLEEEGVKIGDTVQIEKSEIVDPTEVVGEQTQTTTSTLSPEEKAAFVAELNEMTLSQLKEQAKPFKPSSEWRNLSKEDLKQYLISKF